MYIDHISLLDYRTYALLSLPLSAGVTVFLGSNGVGKTNIVEAIDCAASLSSHRVSYDGPLVRMGALRAYIRTRTVRGSQQTVTEFEIARGRVTGCALIVPRRFVLRRRWVLPARCCFSRRIFNW